MSANNCTLLVLQCFHFLPGDRGSEESARLNHFFGFRFVGDVLLYFVNTGCCSLGSCLELGWPVLHTDEL